jgi:hypothetical protein
MREDDASSALDDRAGNEMLKAVRQVRNLFVEVSRLLSTADGLMQETGWVPAYGSYAISNFSYAISSPRAWMPYVAWRFYKDQSASHLLTSIGVVLEDENDNTSVTQPLLFALAQDYGQGVDVGPNWDSRYASLHCRRRDFRVDGTPSAVEDVENVPWKAGLKPKRAVSFGLPLVSITGSTDLRDRVVSPLVRSAREAPASG